MELSSFMGLTDLTLVTSFFEVFAGGGATNLEISVMKDWQPAIKITAESISKNIKEKKLFFIK